MPKCSMHEQEGILQEMQAHLTSLYLASQALCMRDREAAWHTQVRSWRALHLHACKMWHA